MSWPITGALPIGDTAQVTSEFSPTLLWFQLWPLRLFFWYWCAADGMVTAGVVRNHSSLPLALRVKNNGTSQGDHFPDHMKFLTFPVRAGKDVIIDILFNAMVNSRCFTLIKNRPGSQGFKHCNRLTEDYNSVNEEHIPTPGPQAGNSCNLSFSVRSNSKMKQISVTLTFSISDFSMTTLEFPDYSRFSGFSRLVVTLIYARGSIFGR